MSNEKQKISCHVCKKDIPEAAAVHAEGEEYVLHFCDIACMDFWKDEEKKKQEK
jgi:hypothetical protein